MMVAMCVVQDLFFRYRWNNILHTLVENIVHAVLASDTSLKESVLLLSAGLM